MENRKYKLTNTTIRYMGRKLYRIKALKDFSDVKKGDLGGWVFSKNNLSQEGDCWIYNNAKCMDNARMYDNSTMFDRSEMHDNTIMYDYSRMHGNSAMYDYSKMYGNSAMYGYSRMLDYTTMYGNSEMHDYSKMCDNSEMHEGSKMYNNSIISEHGEMWKNGVLDGDKNLYGKLVSKVDKFIDVINPRQGRIVTGVLKNGEILYNVGCQNEITKETFVNRIYNEDGGIERNPHREEYLKIIDMIELYLLK